MEAFSHSFNTPFMLLFSSLLCSVLQAVVPWAASLDLFCFLVIVLLLGAFSGLRTAGGPSC